MPVDRREFLALVAALPLVAAPARARSESDFANAIISEVERQLIHEFYGLPWRGQGGGGQGNRGQGGGQGGRGRGGDLPPGLQRHLNRQGQLPPGLQRHLDRDGRLPPGLDRSPLPGDLLGRLPRLHSSLERVIVGGDTLLIVKATGLVLDAILGVPGT